MFLTTTGYLSPPTVKNSVFAFTICHELGHHLGGRPTIDDNPYRGPHSIEGQADYYAATICFPKYLEYYSPSDDEWNALSPKFRDDAHQLCANTLPDQKRVQACEKTIKSGALLIQAFALKLKENINIEDLSSLDDVPPVLSLFYSYPSLKCRFKTLVQGALGKERPNCWYAPEKK